MINSFIANIVNCDALKMPLHQPVKLIHKVFAIFTMFAIRNRKNINAPLQGVKGKVVIILIIRTYVLIYYYSLLPLARDNFQLFIANIANIAKVLLTGLSSWFNSVFETSHFAMFAIKPQFILGFTQEVTYACS